jgi:hypothetical protein
MDDEAATNEKNEQYGGRRASEKLPFGGRVEGSASQSSLKEQDKGREAYAENFFRCGKMLRFYCISSILNKCEEIER